MAGNANAGLFDSFKDPASLILNQKSCFLGLGSGEIVDGNYIVNGVAIVVNLKKLDKNRASFDASRGNAASPFVVKVEVVGKQIKTFAPDGRELIYCNLD